MQIKSLSHPRDKNGWDMNTYVELVKVILAFFLKWLIIRSQVDSKLMASSLLKLLGFFFFYHLLVDFGM